LSYLKAIAARSCPGSRTGKAPSVHSPEGKATGIETAAGIQAVQPSAYFSLFGIKEHAV
jgi:hypothetical protein